MRYHLIANRQPIFGCLFLFLLFSACRSLDGEKKNVRLEARSVLIEYAGDQSLEQGDFIQINGKLFWHDSLFVFHPKSTDTIYLPTQRYIADKPPGGRSVYSTANALSCMIQITDILIRDTDTSKYQIDVTRLPAGQIRIHSIGKASVEVIASKDYPLRLTAVKN
jgi:hypothetical protein